MDDGTLLLILAGVAAVLLYNSSSTSTPVPGVIASSPIVAAANTCPTGTIWTPHGGLVGQGVCLPPGAVS